MPNNLNKIGSKNKVKKVEDTRPPITTMARGRWISEPGPVANNKGIKPKAAILAVINTGLNRREEPSVTTLARFHTGGFELIKITDHHDAIQYGDTQ